MTTGLAGGVENFVDRVEHLTELRSLLADVTRGRRGRAVVIESVAGMGRSALLEKFETETIGYRPPCRVVHVRCQPVIGPGMPFGMILEAGRKLEGDDRTRWSGGSLRRTGALTARGADAALPDLLSMAVPGLGIAYSLGAVLARSSLKSGHLPGDDLHPNQHGDAEKIVETVLRLARSGPPVVLIVDDLQFCDPSSLLALSKLLPRLPAEPLGVVLSHSTEGVASENPGIGPLMDRWARDELLVRRTMEGLPPHAVGELAMRHEVPTELARELHEMTSGHAVFLALLLEDWENGKTPTRFSDDLKLIVRRRLEGLDDRERDVVLYGAVQGEVFLSRTVAKAKGIPHDDVMVALASAADKGLVIRDVEPRNDGVPGWVGPNELDGSNCYRFEHRALWQIVYEEHVKGAMKSSWHAATARAMTPGPLAGMHLARRLEIARHLREGGRECLFESARAHYELARDTALGGTSLDAEAGRPFGLTEAARHCRVAIEALQKLPEVSERDRAFVDAVELLLALTEVRWLGRNGSAGPDIDDLAEQAELAAARCGRLELQIRTTMQRGKTLLVTRGLAPSLDKLAEAVAMAEEHRDLAMLFVARVEYGRQLSKRRLAAGLVELRKAEAMYETGQIDSAAPVLQHARNLGEMQLGISLFDSGDLGEALDRVQRCVERLRTETLRAELPIALNYLAQIHAALGSYESAESVLREAIDLETERGGDSGWRAYNKALLARLLVVGPRYGEALDRIEDAWSETERTWLVNLVPIVRNLYAETLLLAPGGSEELLQRADRLAGTTLAETRETGMLRSEIAAHSLRGRILGALGDSHAAQENARTAVRILAEVGAMPALLSEEVYYHAAVTLSTTASTEARDLLERARREIAGKAATIPDESLRRQFLSGVPLNDAIGRGTSIE
ncbi:hypothetical protein GCM10027059_24690 [Myceligenerans halotolerans]